MASRRKRKLCFVVPTHWSANFGGAEQQACCLLEVLAADESFDITFLARNIDPNFTPDGYKTKKIGTRSRLSRFGYFFDTKSLYAALKEIEPDVIYQNVGNAYAGVAAFYAKRNNSKMVLHIASDADVKPFDASLSRNMTFQYIEKKFLEYGIRHADFIIAQTQQQMELLYENYKRKPNTIVPNFHPLPTDEIKKEKDISVVWVANFKPLKQPELFIKLARDLDGTEGVRFRMIGRADPPEARRVFLHETAHLDRFEYLGELSHREVNDILARSHILINTSKYEGFPNTFIQAWMRQVPVISLAVNPDDILVKNNIGLFSGSYEQMLRDVERLIQDPDLRRQLGDNAKAYAFANHSVKNIEQIIRILDK